MTTEDLTHAEIVEITGKTRPAPQAKKLVDMGVPFTFLGRVVKVSRAAAMVHQLLPQRQPQGIDFSKVR